ncbi:Protein of unknown function [Gryllus bimaculatus]|nr:Protein of unknown function [Gryllus bimaculatus]
MEVRFARGSAVALAAFAVLFLWMLLAGDAGALWPVPTHHSRPAQIVAPPQRRSHGHRPLKWEETIRSDGRRNALAVFSDCLKKGLEASRLASARDTCRYRVTHLLQLFFPFRGDWPLEEPYLENLHYYSPTAKKIGLENSYSEIGGVARRLARGWALLRPRRCCALRDHGRFCAGRLLRTQTPGPRPPLGRSARAVLDLAQICNEREE